MKIRLERDGERERALKGKDNHELEDAKEEARRESQQKIRDKKRQVEKSIRDTLREQRERFEEEQE